jgi:purine-binding chemotaxis protein CheW
MSTSPQSPSTTATAAASLAGRYLTFLLGGESFGIEVIRIREIIRMTDITVIPQMPEFVRGVINLRGKIVPIVDLRVKFGLPVPEATERTSIIVTQIKGSAGALVWVGFIVDDVEEVTNIAAADVEPAPDFGMAVDTGYIRGMAKTKGGVKTLFEVDRIIASDAVECALRAAGGRA